MNNNDFTTWLFQKCWLECHYTFKNITVGSYTEHPLLIIDAILKHASHQCTTPWLPWFFRVHEYLDKNVIKNKEYKILIIFPNCTDKKIGKSITDALEKWLTTGGKNFILEDVGIQKIVTMKDAVNATLNHISQPEIQNGVALDVITPLPVKSHLNWSGTISAPWLGEKLLQRAERLFGTIEKTIRTEELDKWSTKKLIPWYWEYEKHKHISQSSSGTRFLNGFCGTLYLEGNLENIFPLLCLGSRLNVGSRLSASQGAYNIISERPFLDLKLADKQTWLTAWTALAKHNPAIPFSLPTKSFDIINTQVIKAKTNLELPNDNTLNDLIGFVLFAILKKPLALLSQELCNTWSKIKPKIPTNSEFIEALTSVIPKIDTKISNVLNSYIEANSTTYTNEESCFEELWEPEVDPSETACTNTDASSKPHLKRPCYILRHGAAVSLANERIYTRYDGELGGNIPLGHVSMLILQASGSITLPLIRACAHRSIPIIFTSASGSFQNMLLPEGAALRERSDTQLRHWDQLADTGRMQIAILLLKAKFKNYIAWLETLGSNGKALAANGELALEKLNNITERQQALGVEGSFARQCFQFTNKLITIPGFLSIKRIPHKRHDPWNCLLDLCSYLVFNRLCVLLKGEGLSPYRGFLHCQHSRYATLAADLQELFRARTESWLVKIVNNQSLDLKYLIKPAGTDTWSFDHAGWPKLLELFEQELASHRQNEPGTWSEIMEEQIQRLRFWCTGKAKLTFYTGTEWWQPEM